MSYLRCSNWCQISILVSNFGCLFTFCYSSGTNLSKTSLQTCNLQTGQSINYKYVHQFSLNLQKVNKHPKFDNNFGIQRRLEHFEYETDLIQSSHLSLRDQPPLRPELISI